MKLIPLLLIAGILNATAGSFGQNVTLSLRKVPVSAVLQTIIKQTHVSILYDKSRVNRIGPVSIDVKDATINETLDIIFRDQPLTYSYTGNTIVIRDKEGPATKLNGANSDEITVTPIRGRVLLENNEPAFGATVTIKSAGGQPAKGVITNEKGSFTINASPGDVLVVSYVGYVTQEIKIGSDAALTIVLAPQERKVDEIVVVGYGTQKKSSLTAAISSVKGEDIAKQPVADLTSALGGRVTGVLFTQPTGQAGNDGANIMIRGIGTNGNSQPLYIVDGVPRNFNQINPADIASISILKDAAAVAPYGMGGANGVILVTTKKGKEGRPRLVYDGYVGVQSPAVITHFVSSYQFAMMKNAAAANDGNPAPFTDYDLQKYKDGTDPDGHPNTDPIADLIRRNTIFTSHSLSLNGGTDKIRYNMGLGYLFQDGMLPNLNYKRYNVSSNIEVQATNTTKVGLSLNGRVEDRRLTADGMSMQGMFENLINTLPTDPIRFSNGLPTYIYAKYYDDKSYQKMTANVLLSQFSIEQQLPLKGLSVKAVVSYDLNPFDPFTNNGIVPVATLPRNPVPSNAGTGPIASLTRTWSMPFSYYSVDTSKRPYVYTKFSPTTLPSYTEEYHQTQAFTYQGYINYSGNFGRSAVTGLVVLEARNTKATKFSGGRKNYNIPIPELFVGSSASADQTSDGSSLESKQRSVVYRATYGYDDRYLFEAAGRYDGHYYFAPGKRFGFFPAFSVAWRMSRENFIKNNLGWINDLKLRASYGSSGQLAGGPFQYLTGFNISNTTSAILNGTATQGIYEASEPNPNITWEKSKKTDIGFDATLWDGLLRIEADYFLEKRSNMLIYPDVTVPAEYGIGISQINAGVMKNRGFEISLGSTYRINSDLTIGIDGNFSFARNKLIQVFETATTYNNPNRRITGRPLLTPFGLKALGYFKAEDFDASGNLKDGIAKQTYTAKLYPGDIRYADLSGPDGKPDGVIDENDQIAMGYPTYPAIVYGFTPSVTYKNFQLSLLFQGAGQREVQLSSSAVWPFDNGKSAVIGTLDYWTPENPNAPNPRLTSSPTVNNTQTSTFWQRSVAYLRLRTGLLSYSLPTHRVKRAGMSSVRVYLSGQNIFTWSSMKNFDPEMSNGRGWYFPTQKSMTAGLSVEF